MTAEFVARMCLLSAALGGALALTSFFGAVLLLEPLIERRRARRLAEAQR